MPGTLLELLEGGGFRGGRITLAEVWPAVTAWWRAPGDDERTFYVADGAGGFLGTPPAAIAGRSVVGVEFGRERAPAGDSGMTLWYPAGPAWDRLAQMPEWIDAGGSTARLDLHERGDAAWLISWLEGAPVFQVAAQERILAADVDGLVVVAA